MSTADKKFQSFKDKRKSQSEETVVKTPKSKPLFTKKTIALLLAAIAVVVLGLFLTFHHSASSVVSKVFSQVSMIKQDDGRTNILLLGNAGGTHDGPELTDSIIVASIDHATKKATLISIPRDLWLQSINQKINVAYYLGNKREDNGLKFAEDKIDDILGLPIHYGVRVDFSGFSTAVDQIGGIDVDIPHTFDDYLFPVVGKEDDLCGYLEQEIDVDEAKAAELNLPLGKQKVFVDVEGKVATGSAEEIFTCRYQHLHYDKGLTHFNGEEALNFVRSRHGNNNEGTDFARSRRQQLVLEAFRSKVLSLNTFANPVTVWGLLDTFGQSFETDIPKEAFLEFYKLAQDIEQTESIVLGDLGDGKSVLINPPAAQYGGAWVLIPPNNDFSRVQTLIKETLEGSAAAKLSTPSPLK